MPLPPNAALKSSATLMVTTALIVLLPHQLEQTSIMMTPHQTAARLMIVRVLARSFSLEVYLQLQLPVAPGLLAGSTVFIVLHEARGELDIMASGTWTTKTWSRRRIAPLLLVSECEPVADSSNSNTLFETAAACCSGKLGWIPSATCAAVSTSGVAATATGTDKYYADYSNSSARCAKDCNTSGDPTCGGILSNVAGVQMFDTASPCCIAKFSWMDKDLCASLTTGSHTDKWYDDYQSNKCKKDCTAAANSPCGRRPPDLSIQLFADAATCCSSKLGWVQKDTCIRKFEILCQLQFWNMQKGLCCIQY
jgi:hypothetical protein